jgi:hypothetical protein
MKSGDILSRFRPEMVEAGPKVTRLAKGERVVVPFVIACGSCFFCDMQLFSACETTNPDRGAIMNKKSLLPGAALFGFSHLYGGVAGGQAEYVRVPKANVGPIRIPPALADEQVLFLSDILPTGYQCRAQYGVTKGAARPSSAPGRSARWLRPAQDEGLTRYSWSTITSSGSISRPGPMARCRSTLTMAMRPSSCCRRPAGAGSTA